MPCSWQRTVHWVGHRKAAFKVLVHARRLATEAAAQHAAEAANQVAAATAATAQAPNPIFLRPANGAEPAAAAPPGHAPVLILT